MNELYYATKRKEMYLRQIGYKYICIWEHEFLRNMNLEDVMKEYVTSLEIQERINVREPFFWRENERHNNVQGGRKTGGDY